MARNSEIISKKIREIENSLDAVIGFTKSVHGSKKRWATQKDVVGNEIHTVKNTILPEVSKAIKVLTSMDELKKSETYRINEASQSAAVDGVLLILNEMQETLLGKTQEYLIWFTEKVGGLKAATLKDRRNLVVNRLEWVLGEEKKAERKKKIVKPPTRTALVKKHKPIQTERQKANEDTIINNPEILAQTVMEAETKRTQTGNQHLTNLKKTKGKVDKFFKDAKSAYTWFFSKVPIQPILIASVECLMKQIDLEQLKYEICRNFVRKAVQKAIASVVQGIQGVEGESEEDTAKALAEAQEFMDKVEVWVEKFEPVRKSWRQLAKQIDRSRGTQYSQIDRMINEFIDFMEKAGAIEDLCEKIINAFPALASGLATNPEDLWRRLKSLVPSIPNITIPKLFPTADNLKPLTDEMIKAMEKAFVQAIIQAGVAMVADVISNVCPEPGEDFENVNDIVDNELKRRVLVEDFEISRNNLDDVEAFLSAVSSLLTPLELCNLFNGIATIEVYEMVSSLLQVDYPQIRGNFSDLARIRDLFTIIGTLVDPGFCEQQMQIPVIRDFCFTPESNEFKCREALLKGAGENENNINNSLNLLKKQKVLDLRRMLDMIGNDNILDAVTENPDIFDSATGAGMFPSDHPMFKNVANKTIESVFGAALNSYNEAISDFPTAMSKNVEVDDKRTIADMPNVNKYKGKSLLLNKDGQKKKSGDFVSHKKNQFTSMRMPKYERRTVPELEERLSDILEKGKISRKNEHNKLTYTFDLPDPSEVLFQKNPQDRITSEKIIPFGVGKNFGKEFIRVSYEGNLNKAESKQLDTQTINVKIESTREITPVQTQKQKGNVKYKMAVIEAPVLIDFNFLPELWDPGRREFSNGNITYTDGAPGEGACSIHMNILPYNGSAVEQLPFGHLVEMSKPGKKGEKTYAMPVPVDGHSGPTDPRPSHVLPDFSMAVSLGLISRAGNGGIKKAYDNGKIYKVIRDLQKEKVQYVFQVFETGEIFLDRIENHDDAGKKHIIYIAESQSRKDANVGIPVNKKALASGWKMRSAQAWLGGKVFRIPSRGNAEKGAALESIFRLFGNKKRRKDIKSDVNGLVKQVTTWLKYYPWDGRSAFSDGDKKASQHSKQAGGNYTIGFGHFMNPRRWVGSSKQAGGSGGVEKEVNSGAIYHYPFGGTKTVNPSDSSNLLIKRSEDYRFWHGFDEQHGNGSRLNPGLDFEFGLSTSNGILEIVERMQSVVEHNITNVEKVLGIFAEAGDIDFLKLLSYEDFKKGIKTFLCDDTSKWKQWPVGKQSKPASISANKVRYEIEHVAKVDENIKKYILENEFQPGHRTGLSLRGAPSVQSYVFSEFCENKLYGAFGGKSNILKTGIRVSKDSPGLAGIQQLWKNIEFFKKYLNQKYAHIFDGVYGAFGQITADSPLFKSLNIGKGLGAQKLNLIELINFTPTPSPEQAACNIDFDLMGFNSLKSKTKQAYNKKESLKQTVDDILNNDLTDVTLLTATRMLLRVYVIEVVLTSIFAFSKFDFEEESPPELLVSMIINRIETELLQGWDIRIGELEKRKKHIEGIIAKQKKNPKQSFREGTLGQNQKTLQEINLKIENEKKLSNFVLDNFLNNVADIYNYEFPSRKTSVDHKHSHRFYVDANGNGTAFEVVEPDDPEEVHSHKIINWNVQSDGKDLHSHEIPLDFKYKDKCEAMRKLIQLELIDISKKVKRFLYGRDTIKNTNFSVHTQFLKNLPLVGVRAESLAVDASKMTKTVKTTKSKIQQKVLIDPLVISPEDELWTYINRKITKPGSEHTVAGSKVHFPNKDFYFIIEKYIRSNGKVMNILELEKDLIAEKIKSRVAQTFASLFGGKSTKFFDQTLSQTKYKDWKFGIRLSVVLHEDNKENKPFFKFLREGIDEIRDTGISNSIEHQHKNERALLYKEKGVQTGVTQAIERTRTRGWHKYRVDQDWIGLWEINRYPMTHPDKSKAGTIESVWFADLTEDSPHYDKGTKYASAVKWNKIGVGELGALLGVFAADKLGYKGRLVDDDLDWSYWHGVAGHAVRGETASKKTQNDILDQMRKRGYTTRLEGWTYYTLKSYVDFPDSFYDYKWPFTSKYNADGTVAGEGKGWVYNPAGHDYTYYWLRVNYEDIINWIIEKKLIYSYDSININNVNAVNPKQWTIHKSKYKMCHPTGYKKKEYCKVYSKAIKTFAPGYVNIPLVSIEEEVSGDTKMSDFFEVSQPKSYSGPSAWKSFCEKRSLSEDEKLKSALGGTPRLKKEFEKYYCDCLLEKLENTDEYKLIFNYSFPLTNIFETFVAYNMFYAESVTDIEDLFSSTKNILKHMDMSLRYRGDQNSSKPQRIKTNLSIPDQKHNLPPWGGVDALMMGIAKKLVTTPMHIFKALIENFDPQIAYSKRIADLATAVAQFSIEMAGVDEEDLGGYPPELIFMPVAVPSAAMIAASIGTFLPSIPWGFVYWGVEPALKFLEHYWKDPARRKMLLAGQGIDADAGDDFLELQCEMIREQLREEAKLGKSQGPVVQINLFTGGDEFKIENTGGKYEGFYHVYEDGTRMTGASPREGEAQIIIPI